MRIAATHRNRLVEGPADRRFFERNTDGAGWISRFDSSKAAPQRSGPRISLLVIPVLLMAAAADHEWYYWMVGQFPESTEDIRSSASTFAILDGLLLLLSY